MKCDCRFYQYWKTLKGKGIAIQGYCSDSSGDLNGISIDKLKEGSFSCGECNLSFKNLCLVFPRDEVVIVVIRFTESDSPDQKCYLREN